MRILICALVMLAAAPAGGAELIAGPMVGHTTTSDAKIWVETDAG